MKNVLLSILIIISLFCLYFRYFILKNIKYKEVMLVKNFFNENELENLKTADNIKFYRNTVENIKNKLKRIKKTNYIDIGHIRWSLTTKNYDGRSYHKDIKPLFNKSMKIPKVYTLAIFLDEAYHYQGGELFKLNPGDAVLFNASNLHKGYTKNFFRKTPRRVIQVFNIVFSERDKDDFSKHHAYSINPYIQGLFAILIKNINRFVDFRSEIEYYNLSSLLLKYNKGGKDIKYLSAIDNKGYIGTYDNVMYFSKF